jgi:hypothetical protein
LVHLSWFLDKQSQSIYDLSQNFDNQCIYALEKSISLTLIDKFSIQFQNTQDFAIESLAVSSKKKPLMCRYTKQAHQISYTPLLRPNKPMIIETSVSGTDR